jgi:hypothetical protein
MSGHSGYTKYMSRKKTVPETTGHSEHYASSVVVVAKSGERRSTSQVTLRHSAVRFVNLISCVPTRFAHRTLI